MRIDERPEFAQKPAPVTATAEETVATAVGRMSDNNYGAVMVVDEAGDMAGILTQAQIDSLDAARGPEFDRLFLTYMIEHHRGAVTMVDALFETDGAAEDEAAFRLASDINADQTTEIERMERMLGTVPGAGPPP